MRSQHSGNYAQRLLVEHDTFAAQDDLHGSLPESAHYWSSRYMLPKLQQLGVSDVDELITGEIGARAERLDRDVTVLSLGSGNGDQELGWLRSLVARGARNVRLRLLEVNQSMQRRAEETAANLGLADRVELVHADFNSWCADAEHDVVVGYQALHHVLSLEHLYEQVRSSLTHDGVFIVHDMIGRNGHRRWPEALEVVERIWSTLPAKLRYNHVTGEVDKHFDDRDCAAEGFEGIRAQDVLPTLLEYFSPSLFLGTGNVIDPFVDRTYGHNFDMTDERDRELIDHIGTLDDSLIDLGVVTPTRMTAMFHPGEQPQRIFGDRDPWRCVRDSGTADVHGRVSFDPVAADGGGLVSGAGLVVGRIRGVAHDHWASNEVDLPIFAVDDVTAVALSVYVPDWMPQVGQIQVSVAGVLAGTLRVNHGLTEGALPIAVPRRRQVTLSLTADWVVNPYLAGIGTDRRPLSYVAARIELRR